jgi:hypothetical protein
LRALRKLVDAGATAELPAKAKGKKPSKARSDGYERVAVMPWMKRAS